MPPAARDRVKQADLPQVLTGPVSGRLTLRILFADGDAADVELCLQEIRRVHTKVNADVVQTPKQFSEHLRSKYYDVVIAEYPAPNWQGQQPVAILQQIDRHIPCIL